MLSFLQFYYISSFNFLQMIFQKWYIALRSAKALAWWSLNQFKCFILISIRFLFRLSFLFILIVYPYFKFESYIIESLFLLFFVYLLKKQNLMERLRKWRQERQLSALKDRLVYRTQNKMTNLLAKSIDIGVLFGEFDDVLFLILYNLSCQ